MDFLQAEEVNQREIHHRFQGLYGCNSLSRKEVNVRRPKFKDGRTEKKRGKPRTFWKPKELSDQNSLQIAGCFWVERIKEKRSQRSVPKISR
ncbi:hypothetical protein AVEN_188808-1 [Araneus ventricosus]|uniref:Uncharacterized protein n=1 Tax=Araneus ventricosus TaxID=182803 RepID=A0A4Y2BS64_ARAVE|nr:hypothetical protein AVEN_188808-1 [Araneus ventricosus]